MTDTSEKPNENNTNVIDFADYRRRLFARNYVERTPAGFLASLDELMRKTILVSALAEYVTEAFSDGFEKGWLRWKGAELELTDAGQAVRDTGEFWEAVTGNAGLQLDGASSISLALIAHWLERHGLAGPPT